MSFPPVNESGSRISTKSATIIESFTIEPGVVGLAEILRLELFL